MQHDRTKSSPPPRPSPSRGEGEGYVGWELGDCLFSEDYAHLNGTSQTLPHPQPSQSFSPPPPLRGRAGVGGDFGQRGTPT